MNKLTDEQRREMLRILERTKVLDEPPSGKGFHVCSLNPVIGQTNHQDKCHFCGKTVYSAVEMPLYKKVCIPCTTAKSKGKPVKSFITTEAVRNFFNQGKNN